MQVSSPPGYPRDKAFLSSVQSLQTISKEELVHLQGADCPLLPSMLEQLSLCKVITEPNIPVNVHAAPLQHALAVIAGHHYR